MASSIRDSLNFGDETRIVTLRILDRSLIVEKLLWAFATAWEI